MKKWGEIMRKESLRTYTKNKLLDLYQGKLYFSKLFAESKNSMRLAESCQAYYLAHGDQVKADAFSKFTGEKFSVDEFESSNQKYAYEFRRGKNDEHEYKNFMYDELVKFLQNTKKSEYWLAKELKTTPGNLYSFLKKKQFNTLSKEKFELFYKKHLVSK